MILVIILCCQYGSPASTIDRDHQIDDVARSHQPFDDNMTLEQVVTQRDINRPPQIQDAAGSSSSKIAENDSRKLSGPNPSISTDRSSDSASPSRHVFAIKSNQDPTAIISLMSKGHKKQAMARLSRVLQNVESLLRSFPTMDHVNTAAATWQSVINCGGEKMHFVELFMQLFTNVCRDLSSESVVPSNPLTAYWILFRSALRLDRVPDEFAANIWHLTFLQTSCPNKCSRKCMRLLSVLKKPELLSLIADIHKYIDPNLGGLWARVDNNHLLFALRFMKKIYNQNLARNDAVPFEHFYNDMITISLSENANSLTHQKKVIISKYPFVIGLQVKQKLLKLSFKLVCYSVSITVNRESVIDDAIAAVDDIQQSLFMDDIKVSFKGELGQDRGGLTKEFFNLFSLKLPEDKVFVVDDETGNMWFNPKSSHELDRLYRIGAIIGLGFRLQIPMALHFPECFYKHILGKPTGMKDLASYSPALYRSMQYLLDPSRTADDMAIMNLPFELNQKPTQTGKRRHRYERDEPKRIRHDQGHGDLKTKLVDLANRFEYVEAYTQKLLFTDVKKQYQAFCKGFRKIIAKEPMPSLNHRELELLLCGSAAYDFADLRQFTRLALQYSEDHPVIKNFWEVLFELDSEDKKLFLQFVTGNCRLPVGGAAALRPHFTIHWVSSDLTMNLPCSHTCANILELPPYSNKETLQDKLLKAIRECGQFSFR